MMKINYELGKTYMLPVTEVIHENRRSFYKVVANGQEYNIQRFEFQNDDEKPEEISCLVKEIRDGQPLFVQDTQKLLMRLYHEGETYPFWVKQDRTHFSTPYYEISDWNGFTFKLSAYWNEKLRIRQRIECLVTQIVDGHIYLSLIQKENQSLTLPFITLENLFEEIDIHHYMSCWLNKMFNRNRFFKSAKEAYENENEEWLMMTVEELDKQMDVWITQTKRPSRYLLEAYKRLCVYLLEDSDTLMSCSEQERDGYQKMLSHAIQSADICLEAIDLMRNGTHTMTADIILTKMRKSGFLYSPDRRLKVLMCLLSLDKQLMESKMNIIFDIIIRGDHTNWMREPFRSAFIEMLDLFITQNRSKVDRLSEIRTEEDKQNLHKLISALTIQLLLMNEKDYYDRQLSRSMLYRYLTYIRGSKKETLLEKAFLCLTEAEQSQLEFDWKGISDMTMLAIRTSSIQPKKSSSSTCMQTYNGKESCLQIVDGNIEVHPIETRGREVAVLPEGLLPWHHIQVFLKNGVGTLAKGEKNLLACQKFWKDIEYSLTDIGNVSLPKSRNRKIRPEKGDEVYIRMKRQNFENPGHFFCEIEDDTFYGTGQISTRNIVKYNVSVDESVFCNLENQPYLLKAKVLSVDSEGNYHFIITDLINEFVRDCVSIGEETLCVVTDINATNILCVSEQGYSLNVPITEAMDGLELGQYIKVQVENIRINGTVDGVYVQTTIGNFTCRDAFEDLLFSYADGKYYEAPVEEKDIVQQEVTMDESYVKEIICIIDRLAILSEDQAQTYNYLSFARILSLIIRDREAGVYYNERLRLLLMLHHFAVNGSVSRQRIDDFISNSSISIGSYPIIQSRLSELQLISCMDKPDEDKKVWDLLQNTKEEHLISLCRLVLAYNSLKGFNMFNERETIRKRICQELDLKIEEDDSVYFGEESLYCEFKTSVVYPSNNGMRQDVVTQTRNILKVICGFLNAEGGVLYIGVNNEGVAVGLDNDLAFFGGKDKFDLHVRNHIALELGVDANSYIREIHPAVKDKYVYALEIRPSIKPVELDGICYQRQGTSTWPLMEDNLVSFKARREEEVKRIFLEQPLLGAPFAEEASAVVADSSPEVVVNETKSVSMVVKNDGAEIQPSRLRDNPVHSWEDNFGVGTVCYLHILSGGEYKVTDDEIWDDVKITLAIREEDEWVVVVYENGKAIRVPVAQLLDKMNKGVYKMCTDRVLFVCPARATDLLMTESRKYDGQNYVRVDDVTILKEGKISDAGERISEVEYECAVLCDILDAQHKTPLKKLYGLRNTHLGHATGNSWCKDEMDYLRNLLQHN